METDFRADKTPAKWPKDLMKPSRLQKCLHATHLARLSRLIHALWESPDLKHRRWASRLADCCRFASITVNLATGDTKPWLSTCGSRLCPFCGRGRAGRLARELLPPIDAMERPKLLTLTFRSVNQPLPDQLRKLRRCFARLRRTRLWRQNVKGGIYSVEVTYNTSTGLWHPHLHTVIDAKFMPQAVLAKLWGSLIGDTAYVWITQVTNPANTAWELGKYVGKAPDMTAWPEHCLTTYADALHGQRMIQPYGYLHGTPKPKPDEPPADPPETREICIAQVAYLASQGNAIAQDLAAVMLYRWPAFRRYLLDNWPAVDQVDVLLSIPEARVPRGPPQPNGRAGVCRDPAQVQELENLMALLAVQWFRWEDSPLFPGQYEHMELPA